MDPSREERMQQRLRGAQRRQIKDVDFGLSIPAAPALAQSPPPVQAAQPPPTSPVSNQQTLPVLPPLSTTSIPETTRQMTSQGVNDANTSAKRRKLDSDPPTASSARSTRSSRASIPAPHAFPEDELTEQVDAETLDAFVEPAQDVANPESILQEDTSMIDSIPEPKETPTVHFAEESTIISIEGPITDKMIEAALVDTDVSDPQEATTDSPVQLSELETPVPVRKRKRGSEERQGPSKLSQSAVEDDFDELSPEQPTRRASKTKGLLQEVVDDDERDPLSDPLEPDMAEDIDDEAAAAILMKNRSKRKSLDPTSSFKRDEIEASDLPEPKRRRDRQREDSVRAEQRQPKSSSSKKVKQSSGKAKSQAGGLVPVTVHRLTRRPVYGEDELDADILNAEIPHTKRSGVNAVDVLNGLCEEIIRAGLETLEEGKSTCEDPALKREYTTKWRAVKAFGEEVQARLIEHTVNLDNVYSLERRVKEENKNRIGIREEILRVRAEREKVALRMDDVRIRHENEATSARDLNSLDTSLHDIELAVERGKTLESDESIDVTPNPLNIEMQLKRVAGEVSNKGHSGGLLQQIKSFNAFLERAALALETRRV